MREVIPCAVAIPLVPPAPRPHPVGRLLRERLSEDPVDGIELEHGDRGKSQVVKLQTAGDAKMGVKVGPIRISAGEVSVDLCLIIDLEALDHVRCGLTNDGNEPL